MKVIFFYLLEKAENFGFFIFPAQYGSSVIQMIGIIFFSIPKNDRRLGSNIYSIQMFLLQLFRSVLSIQTDLKKLEVW